MGARTYVSAEALARTTTNTTDYSYVKISQAYTPTPGSTSIILWSLLTDYNWGRAEPAKQRLINTTDGVTLQELISNDGASTGIGCFSGMAYHTDAGAGATKTFEIQCASGHADWTLGMQEATLFIMELGSMDVFASSTGTSSLSDTTPTTKVSLSIPTQNSNDYLIIGSASCSSTTGEISVRMYNGTTAYGVAGLLFYSYPGEWHPYCHAVGVTNLSASTTYSLQYYSNGATEVQIRQAYIVALCLGDYHEQGWTVDRTQHSTNLAVFADSASMSGTPNNGTYITMAFGLAGTTGAATNQSRAKINVGGSDVGSVFLEHSAYVGYWASWMQFRVAARTSVATTWKTQYACTDLIPGDNALSDEHVIAALMLTSMIGARLLGFVHHQRLLS